MPCYEGVSICFFPRLPPTVLSTYSDRSECYQVATKILVEQLLRLSCGGHSLAVASKLK